MAQKTTKEEKVTQPQEDKCCACKGCACKKRGALAIGVLAVSAIAIWAVIANNWIQLPTKSATVNDGKVVASVNGEAIYLSDVEQIAAQIPQLAELPFDMIYPKLLEGMINDKVLQQAAQDANLEKDPIVQKRLQEVHNQILSRSYLMNKLNELATEEELKKLYVEEIKSFPRQEEVHARHILVKTEKEAQDIRIQLKAGADFAMLANTKSLDSESNNGGDLGYFRKDMMIPEFTDPVFNMKKGQISDPIKTPFGWHIVLVEDKRLATPPSFEEVRDQLRQILFERNEAAVINSERDRYRVEVIVPSLAIENVEDEAEEATQEEPAEVVETVEAVVVEETPAETPAEAVAETPAETPAEAPAETPAEEKAQ